MTLPGLLTDYADVETWDLDTITFGRVNDVAGTSVYFGIDNVVGWDSSAKPRTGRLAKAAGPGSYRSPNWRGDKIITLEGSAAVPDEPTALQAKLMLSALCGDPTRLYQLRHQDSLSGEDLMREVELDDELMVAVNYRVRPLEVVYSIQLAAPDSVRYSGTQHQVSGGMLVEAPGGVLWDGPNGTSGIQWDGPAGTTGVEWESGSGSAGIFTLSATGTADAPIRFTITGPVSSPSIVNVDTDQTITYPGVVAAGQQLVIDTGSHAVLLNGANRRPQLTRSDFFSIPAGGSVTVAFRGPVADPAALLTAQWRDAWL